MNDTPYLRLVSEKVELGERIVKLSQFIYINDAYLKLTEEMRYLMMDQLNLMQGLFAILQKRIAIFKD